MSQQNQKSQHLEQQKEENKENELGEFELNMAALQTNNHSEQEAQMAKKKAQMAKNELEKAIQRQKNPEKLGALLTNVTAILKEPQKEATTNSSSDLELNLEFKITQNSLDCHRPRVPLPLELNCQIFECLKFGIQRKFIGGLGRGIYGIFRQKVLTKSKRLRNPEQNGWEVSTTRTSVSSNGLLAYDNTGVWQNVFAKKAYPITGLLSRRDHFPGTILYYFEVTNIASSFRGFRVGLSRGNIPDGYYVGGFPNSYAIQCLCDFCWLAGRTYNSKHSFEWPNGAIKPQWKGPGDVYGCGLLLNHQNKLSIFFTGNGLLMGQSSFVNHYFNKLKNCKIYDIKKCPGMGFA